MKKIIYIIIIILPLSYSFCQEKYIQDFTEFKASYLLPQQFELEQFIKVSFDENKVPFVLYSVVQKSDNDWFLQLYNTVEKSFTNVIIPDSIAQKGVVASDFAINQGTLSLIVHNRYVVVLALVNGEYIPKYINKISGYEKTMIANHFIAFYSCSIYNGTRILKIDRNDYNLKKEFVFSDVLGIEFTLFQPKNLINLNDEYIALSHLKNYQIDLYNWEFEKVDSIVINKREWFASEEAEEYFKLSDVSIDLSKAKNIIEQLRPLLYEFSMVHKSYFLSNYSMIIFWSHPNKEEIYDLRFDFIQKKNNNWECFSENLINYSFENGSKLKDMLDRWKLSMSFEVKDGIIYLVEPFPFEIADVQNYSISKIKSKINDYYIDNELRYSLILMGIRK